MLSGGRVEETKPGTACQRAWTCTGNRRGTRPNPPWLTLSAYTKQAMMTRIATPVWQVVEVAGSVMGLRNGTQACGNQGSGSRRRSRRAASVDPVIAIGRADIPQSARQQRSAACTV